MFFRIWRHGSTWAGTSLSKGRGSWPARVEVWEERINGGGDENEGRSWRSFLPDAVSAAFEARAHRLVEGAFGLLVWAFACCWASRLPLLLRLLAAASLRRGRTDGGLARRPRSRRSRPPRRPAGRTLDRGAIGTEAACGGGGRRRHGIDPGLLLRPPAALPSSFCCWPGAWPLGSERAGPGKAHRRPLAGGGCAAGGRRTTTPP